MTETEFIQKALDLAKKGSVLVFVEESRQLEYFRRALWLNAGLTLADMAVGVSSPSVALKLSASAMELQKLGFLISGSFDLKEKQIAKLKPDYVLDERDYAVRSRYYPACERGKTIKNKEKDHGREQKENLPPLREKMAGRRFS